MEPRRISHWDDCNVWCGVEQGGEPDETRSCSCGARRRALQEPPGPPLKMSDEDWLRTLGIKPD